MTKTEQPEQPATKRIKASELTDDHRIVQIMDGRYSKTPSYVWDEGYGTLYAYVETLGIVGYVRASTWEEAYECTQGEIMSDGDYTDAIEDLTPEQIENGDLQEGYGYRGSGVPSNPARTSAIYSEDLNGCALVAVTDAYADEQGIEIYVEADSK